MFLQIVLGLMMRPLKKLTYTLHLSSPRKSLVKGKRFIRFEGRPELTFEDRFFDLYTNFMYKLLVGQELYNNIIHTCYHLSTPTNLYHKTHA